MYYLTDCCRVCLKKENTLVDLIKTEGNTDSLINKLKLCVSEVEWSTNNCIMMCPTCIDKLNSAYEFKNQCLQSTKLFENYKVEFNESQIKDKMVTGVPISLNHDNTNKEHESKNDLTAFLNITPNQLQKTQVSNILLTPNHTASTFQNIFLNLLPSTTIKLSQPNISVVNQKPLLSANDTNHDMFVNINNTLHKILPIVPTNSEVKLVKPLEDVNITKILNESNSEELSVEIDPNCFDCMPEDESQVQCDGSSSPKDWEDLILSNKITPETTITLNDTAEGFQSPNNEHTNDDFMLPTNKFVPIRPKLGNKKNNYLMDEDKMMEFFNIDHFMADKQQVRNAVCEDCGQICDNIKSLHAHIRQVHSGNFPYRCKQCSSVFALQTQFEAHMRKHDVQKPNTFTKEMITLEDLSQQNESLLFPSSAPNDSSNTDSNMDDGDDEGVPNLSLEFKCEVCTRSFLNAQALTRHKFKKHQQMRKKYFVKGMKNAKCDICNREFSTQSYLQLHIKLHFRKMGYRFKVFDKNRYVTDKQDEEKDTDDKENEECDKSLEYNKEQEKDDELKSENGDDKHDDQESSTQGLKIKINLRNLKNSEDVLESIEDAKNKSEATPMEVDPPSEETVIAETGDIEIPLDAVATSPRQNQKDDVSVDEEEKEEDVKTEEPGGELKDEGLPQIQQPPITAELVNGKQQCSFCLKLYRRKHDLKRHLNNIHLKAIQYVCHLCNIPFYEAFQLTRHLRQHNGFVRCGLCLKEYSILRDLKLHISAAHDNLALCQCGTCGQSFQKVRYLREHMHEHDRSIVYKCHLCSDEFKESRDLSRHLVEHSGMYACNICHTTFSAEQELNNHSKCHFDDPGNERKYKCDICPSKFKKKRYLMAHIKKTHGNKNRDILSTRIELDCKSA